jgi:hypothetical protein
MRLYHNNLGIFKQTALGKMTFNRLLEEEGFAWKKTKAILSRGA